MPSDEYQSPSPCQITTGRYRGGPAASTSWLSGCGGPRATWASVEPEGRAQASEASAESRARTARICMAPIWTACRRRLAGGELRLVSVDRTRSREGAAALAETHRPRAAKLRQAAGGANDRAPRGALWICCCWRTSTAASRRAAGTRAASSESPGEVVGRGERRGPPSPRAPMSERRVSTSAGSSFLPPSATSSRATFAQVPFSGSSPSSPASSSTRPRSRSREAGRRPSSSLPELPRHLVRRRRRRATSTAVASRPRSDGRVARRAGPSARWSARSQWQAGRRASGRASEERERSRHRSVQLARALPFPSPRPFPPAPCPASRQLGLQARERQLTLRLALSPVPAAEAIQRTRTDRRPSADGKCARGRLHHVRRQDASTDSLAASRSLGHGAREQRCVPSARC